CVVDSRSRRVESLWCACALAAVSSTFVYFLYSVPIEDLLNLKTLRNRFAWTGGEQRVIPPLDVDPTITEATVVDKGLHEMGRRWVWGSGGLGSSTADWVSSFLSPPPPPSTTTTSSSSFSLPSLSLTPLLPAFFPSLSSSPSLLPANPRLGQKGQGRQRNGQPLLVSNPVAPPLTFLLLSLPWLSGVLSLLFSRLRLLVGGVCSREMSEPSKVIHVRNVGHEITEALIQMHDVASAATALQYYTNLQPNIRGRNVYMQFSSHQELTTVDNSQGSKDQVGSKGGMKNQPPNNLISFVEVMIFPVPKKKVNLVKSRSMLPNTLPDETPDTFGKKTG
ncbi:hypothetical protein Taro_022397, partial [Colocasia esculenta]|nr:hypothetical protein [Colocasia esculenta]